MRKTVKTGNLIQWFYIIGKRVANEPVSLAGDSYLIKKILTFDEALKLLEEDPQIKLITKSESTHGLGKKKPVIMNHLFQEKHF